MWNKRINREKTRLHVPKRHIKKYHLLLIEHDYYLINKKPTIIALIRNKMSVLPE